MRSAGRSGLTFSDSPLPDGCKACVYDAAIHAMGGVRRTPTPGLEAPTTRQSRAPTPIIEIKQEEPVASTSLVPILTITPAKPSSSSSSESAREQMANQLSAKSVSPEPVTVTPPTPDKSPPSDPAPRRQTRSANAKGKAKAVERVRSVSPGRKVRESSASSNGAAPTKMRRKAKASSSTAAPTNRRATRNSHQGKLAVLAFPTRRELNAASGIGSGRRRSSRLNEKLQDEHCELPCVPLWAKLRESTVNFDPLALRDSARRWHDDDSD